MKKCWRIGMSGLFLAGAVQGDTLTALNFSALNSAFSSNTLTVGGSAAGLSVSGAASDNDFLYSVVYTGADFDGDSINDTLLFDVLVEGFSGSVVDGKTLGTIPNGSVADASATIGSTDADATITTGESAAPWVVGTSRFSEGETLKFSIVNAVSSAGTVEIGGFTAVLGQEWYTHSHQAIIGEGVDSLDGYDFNDNRTMTISPAAQPLYVSAANADGNKACWGVGSVDFELTVEFVVERTVVEWSGSVDGSWNMPGNWSANHVPGTAAYELAILNGSNDAPVVATPVETTNSCSIQIINGASLEVCKGELRCDQIMLGNTAGAGGGNLKLWSSADVAVSGELLVGASDASSVSYLELLNGSLNVDGELVVGKGLLQVYGDGCSVDVNDFTLTPDALLRFDFDLYPVSTIQVAGQLTIESGAKLEIDLTGYTMGGNELELITFDSVSGSFDPADITITGLGGGVVTLDEDSLNLTVIDDVADRSCALWFVASAGDGSAYTDLQVNTGRRIRNVSSPDMSYSSVTDGADMVHSAVWSGSDFDGDGVNDTVSFDLRVEGFSGSTYFYSSTNEAASMTQLGSADAVSGDSNGWGVGTDKELDAGETLRFSIENLLLSTTGGSAEGFVGVQLAEVSGHSHVLIIGEGEDLQSQESNYAVSMGFTAVEQLLVTSAADSGVKANKVAFKLMVSEVPDIWDTETGDYSLYPTGPTHREEYDAVTNINFPAWSWDTLQMEAGVGRNDAMPEEVAEIIATTYPMVGLGGRNVYGEDNLEAGLQTVSALLKKYNPNVFTKTYKNAGIHHNRIAANEYFDEEEWALFYLEDGERVYDTLRGWFRYNHDHPQCREWWSDWCVEVLSYSNIDAIFIDKATGGEDQLLNDAGEIEPGSNRVKSYYSIWERQPAGTMLSGNILRTSRFGGYRELLHMFQGSYLEGWEGGSSDGMVAMSRADAVCASMQMMREARVKGMMINPNYASEYSFDLDGASAQALIDEGQTNAVIEAVREAIQVPLAYHLMTLEPYSYFNFQVASSDGGGLYDEMLWNTKPYIEEFRHPLGEPLGPPVQDGYIFTRSYEHVDVWMNVEENPAEVKLTWDWMPIADTQTVSAVEDQAISITLTGSEPRGSNFTFEVFSDPTNGTLSGTAPNLIYTPNPDFFGEDCFAFQTVNDMAKSLKATVSITVAPVDDVPTAEDISIVMTFGNSQSITLPGTDPDGDALSYRVLSAPTNGVLSGTAPDLIYTPSTLGMDRFTYEVDDGTSTSSVATVSIEITSAIYRDRFDNDGLSTNALGIGGGAASVNQFNADWSDNDTLVFATTLNKDWSRAHAYSTNSFAVTNGFELTVSYNCSDVTDNSGNVFSFGMVREDLDPGDYAGNNERSPFGVWDGTTNLYSVGVNVQECSLTSDFDAPVEQGVYYTAGTNITKAADGTTAAGSDIVVVLSVAPDGSGGADVAWSVDGADQSSGTIVDFDFTKKYAFLTYAQDNGILPSINSVRLELLDETGSYTAWAAGYGLSGDDALAEADAENGGAGDGYNNLAEFALGMNPTNADAAAAMQLKTPEAGGTNWFEIIHKRRTDSELQGLSYWLIDSTNLLGPMISTNTQDEIRVGPSVNGYEPVTNRYKADEVFWFIQFKIHQE